MLNYGDTVGAVEAIEKIIQNASYGWANKAAIKEIEAQVLILRTGCSDAYISEKVGTIRENTLDLYSPRKADKWSGSEQVQRTIMTACQSLKDWARVLERQLSS